MGGDPRIRQDARVLFCFPKKIISSDGNGPRMIDEGGGIVYNISCGHGADEGNGAHRERVVSAKF